MKTATFVVIVLLSIFVSFKTMNGMMTHHAARIVLAKEACPVARDDTEIAWSMASDNACLDTGH